MTAPLADLERRLRTLMQGSTLQDLHVITGRAIRQQIEVGFDRQVDPNDRPWQPSRAAVADGRATLTDSRALRDGIDFLADSRGVIVRTTGRANAYAAFHQDGTRYLPERKFMPERLSGRFENAVRTDILAYLHARWGI